ncbi:LysR family transcriptional regulator [Actinomadura gamaensis]|uniref:LysR family transcriptional regulator n=1 Tax=Actinomadura gamaensis TaxID=1763541 RepID=A0ABV9TNX8_9ACTN
MQSRLDLNLLVALDVLLDEGSVTGAAERLHLSGPAMSRTLGRIRRALGDPILVRSGRGMTPTPRALAMHAEVRELVRRANALFTADAEFDPREATGVFTLQSEESTVAVIGGPLLSHLARDAPGLRLRFVGEGPQDTSALRRDTVDLEIGVIHDRTAETRAELLLEDRFVSVVRPGHPLAGRNPTAAEWASFPQLVNSRRGRLNGPIDALLADHDLTRTVIGSVPTITSALQIAADTDLVAFAAERLHRRLVERMALIPVPIPLPLPPLAFSLAWHVRHDADPAHAWLRTRVRDTFLTAAA